MGRKNLSGKTLDKESYQYYSKAYAANKSYYTRSGYTDLIPVKMTKQEWEFNRKMNPGKSNADIVYEEFHRYGKAEAKVLRQQLSESGVKITTAQAARGELTPAGWNVIKNKYKQLKNSGLSSKEAAAEISYEFWGSE